MINYEKPSPEQVVLAVFKILLAIGFVMFLLAGYVIYLDSKQMGL